MSIDIKRDRLLSLQDAAVLVPGKTPHPQTIYRWIRVGIRGVRLDGVIVAGLTWTTEDALFRFLEETSSTAVGA